MTGSEHGSSDARRDGVRGWWIWALGTTVLVLALLAAGLVAARRDDDSGRSVATDAVTTTIPTSTDRPSTSSTSSTMSTATAQLGDFVTRASDADRALTEAASRINGASTEDEITYDQRTVDLLAIDLPGLRKALPAGMPDSLERAALLVYSDLVSRWASMSGWCLSTVGTRPRVDYTDDACFVLGAPAAARFDGDLAALVAAAERTPAFRVEAPDSKRAEALAVRLHSIDLQNTGCANVGGFVATEALPIVWQASPGSEGYPDWEGTVDGIQFFGTYDATTGWTIRLNAC